MKIPSPQYIILSAILLFHLPLQAQKLAFQTTMGQSRPLVFMENKGQLADEKGNALNNIRYYARSSGVNIYCKKDRLMFVFTKTSGRKDWSTFQKMPNLKGEMPDALKQDTIQAARMEMQLLNANPDVEMKSNDSTAYYENYYLAQCPKGITVHGSWQVTYKNIYPKIDMVLRCQAKSIEYSFVVYPGGDPGDIQIQWNGADTMKTLAEDEGFHLSNALGSLDERHLKSFTGTGTPVDCHYLADGNNIRFGVGGYDRSNTLVIDPVLVLGTYFGGEGEDEGLGVSANRDGKVYISGGTQSNSGIATAGAWDTVYKGRYEAFLAQFDNNGKLLWATYFGGWGYEEAFCLCLNSSGQIYMAGVTTSSGLATTGAWDSTYNDLFIARFSDSGKLNWCTYFGRSDDGILAIKCDNFDDFYITGDTYSDSGLATKGAYQVKSGGNIDGYLAKFSSKGILLWCTYFGGFSEDEARGLCIDKYANIYITGGTESPYGLATKGAYQTYNRAYPFRNGFLAKFDSAGSLKWATYFGGNAGDESVCTDIDQSGNIYIVGWTKSKKNVATPGAWDTTYSNNNGEGFLAKFNDDGALIWATYIKNESRAICTDIFGNEYITGYNFIVGFEANGRLNWQRGYSGWVQSICADENRNLYITGSTNDTSGISTPGAYQTKYIDNGDGFLAKFSYKIKYDAGIRSFASPARQFCIATKPLIVNLKNYGTTELDSVNISYSLNGKVQKDIKWVGTLATDSVAQVWLDSLNLPVGADTVKAWTSFPNGFKDSVSENDSFIIVDTVYSFPQAHTGGNQSVCLGSKITLGDSSVAGHTYSWTSKPAGFVSESGSPEVSPAAATWYYLKETISAAGCSQTDSALITVNPLPKAATGGDKAVCAGDSMQLGGSAVSGDTYLWTSKPAGFGSGISHPDIRPFSNTIYYLTETVQATGCAKTDSAIIIVHPRPVVVVGRDTTICSGQSYRLGADPVSGYAYQWLSNPLGINDKSPVIIVSPDQNTLYYLIVTDKNTGCAQTDSVSIAVNPVPVPNSGPVQRVCAGTRIVLGDSIIVPGLQYRWTSLPAGFTSSMAKAKDSPQVSTTYILNEIIPQTGCSATDSVAVQVYPHPSPVITGNDIICGTDPQTYKTDFHPVAAWKWDIKPGKVLTGQYSNTITGTLPYGVDTIMLTETSIYGCIGLVSKIVPVHANPDARFTDTIGDSSYLFKAIDSSEQYYEWTLGDGASGNFYTVSHKYSFDKDTLLQVSLFVANAFGCSSLYDSAINIHYIPPVKINTKILQNPIDNNTRIRIVVEKSAHVQIILYDAIGRMIAGLADEEQPAGQHDYVWYADRYHLAAGIYFVKIMVDGKQYVQKVIKL